MSSVVTPPKTPRPRHTQNLNDILHAARQVFCERGHEATSLADIAAASGIAEEQIRHYFANRDSLLAAVIGHWHECLLAEASRRLAPLHSPRERLQLLVHHYLDSVRSEPQFCGLIFGGARAPHSLLDPRYAQLMSVVIDQGIAQAAFRSDLPPPRLHQKVVGAIEQQVLNALGQLSALEPRASADRIVGALCPADHSDLRSCSPLSSTEKKVSA